jgi:hypothetical protein
MSMTRIFSPGEKERAYIHRIPVQMHQILLRNGIRGQIKWFAFLKFKLKVDKHSTNTGLKTCTLDILMHLSRLKFSRQQIEFFLWALQFNGSDKVPSVRSMKLLQARLQGEIGVRTFEYMGAMKNTYFVNSLGDIIAQVCNQ